MAGIYLIGGGDYRTDELDDIDRAILNDFAPAGTVLIIPFATRQEKRSSWVAAVNKAFSKFKKVKFEVLSEEESKEEKLKKLLQSDMIFFTGGLPDVLMDKLRSAQIIDAIRSYDGIIVGYSAGALVLSEQCLIMKDEDYVESKIIDGLGVLKFTTSVHYEPREDSELLYFSRHTKIYALPNKSALMVRGENLHFFGKAMKFENGKKTIC